ncbi:MAG: DUF4258 domain-containing protein [Candidatus Taylorbacteria bacterium]|nr:DUF4258 domain-containing protein [Candidatus Taylorbacteria bacterium]
MIKLKLTVHVQARLYERNIDIDHVKKAIEKPDEIRHDQYGSRVKKKIGEKMIVVVYSNEKFRDQPSLFLIVTAYYITK